MALIKKCELCLNSTNNTTSLKTHGSDDVPYVDKLHFVAPELGHLDIHQICRQCTTSLSHAFSFKTKCQRRLNTQIQTPQSDSDDSCSITGSSLYVEESSSAIVLKLNHTKRKRRNQPKKPKPDIQKILAEVRQELKIN